VREGLLCAIDEDGGIELSSKNHETDLTAIETAGRSTTKIEVNCRMLPNSEDQQNRLGEQRLLALGDCS
jgi:hypothetical protein